MSHLLTSEELAALTNAKQAKKQREVLDKSGIRYVEGPNGEPATTWEAVNSVLAVSDASNESNFDYGALG